MVFYQRRAITKKSIAMHAQCLFGKEDDVTSQQGDVAIIPVAQIVTCVRDPKLVLGQDCRNSNIPVYSVVVAHITNGRN